MYNLAVNCTVSIKGLTTWRYNDYYRLNPELRREKNQLERGGREMLIVDYNSVKCAYSAQSVHSPSKWHGGILLVNG